MSVFATSPASFFTSPPSYSRSPNTPAEPPSYNGNSKPSQSSISIPSISKLSFSLEPVKRIFSFSQAANNSNPAIEVSHFSNPSTTNSSTAELSTVATNTTGSTRQSSSRGSEIEEIERAEGELTHPPPTYSPIKIPSPSSRQPVPHQPPAYEIQAPLSQQGSDSERRPQTGISRPALTTPYSEYDAGYYASYLGESWAGSRADGGRRDGERMAGEKEDEGSCWCSGWWMMTGSPTMPWVAYYVF